MGLWGRITEWVSGIFGGSEPEKPEVPSDPQPAEPQVFDWETEVSFEPDRPVVVETIEEAIDTSWVQDQTPADWGVNSLLDSDTMESVVDRSNMPNPGEWDSPEFSAHFVAKDEGYLQYQYQGETYATDYLTADEMMALADMIAAMYDYDYEREIAS